MSKDTASIIIHRASHDEDHPYVIISNETLNDTRLGLGALGLYVYIVGFLQEHGRHPTQAELIAGGNGRRKKVRQLLLKLRHYKYLTTDNEITGQSADTLTNV